MDYGLRPRFRFRPARNSSTQKQLEKLRKTLWTQKRWLRSRKNHPIPCVRVATIAQPSQRNQSAANTPARRRRSYPCRTSQVSVFKGHHQNLKTGVVILFCIPVFQFLRSQMSSKVVFAITEVENFAWHSTSVPRIACGMHSCWTCRRESLRGSPQLLQLRFTVCIP